MIYTSTELESKRTLLPEVDSIVSNEKYMRSACTLYVRIEMISTLLEIIRLFCKRALYQMRSTCALHALWYVRIEMISRLLEIIRLFCKRAL